MKPVSVDEIVAADLCIGCGLCQSLAGPERMDFELTDEGVERPRALVDIDDRTTRMIAAVCPGVVAEGARGPRESMWGPAQRMVRGHASDPEVRFRGSSGGSLSALAGYLVESGEVDYVLHVGASADAPARSERRLSFSAAEVLAGAGSRYQPAAPLTDFCTLLDQGRPFAVVGKPCDITAIRNLARFDDRVDELVRYLLTMFCGGASERTITTEYMADNGVTEDEVETFRYRGFGNPGMTHLRTFDGQVFERTYEEFWTGDESNWRVQFRCKICPDSVGELADVAVFDAWPGGMPVDEDEGFNGIVARTTRGADLLEAARAAGALTLLDALTIEDLEDFQPHQRRRKEAVLARVLGRTIAAPGVRTRFRRLGLLREAVRLGPRGNLRNFRGTIARVRQRRER